MAEQTAPQSSEYDPGDRARDEQLLREGPALHPYIDDATWDGMLHRWIRQVLGYNIPMVAVCDCHDAPFQIVADSFFGRVQKTLSHANRTGGKTLGLGLLYAAQMILQSPIDISHAGAKKKQAKRCFRYVGKGLESSGLKKGSGIAAQAAAIDGGGEYHLDNGSEIEVLCGTVASLNSPHTSVFGFDEIELATEEALDEAKSIPVSKNGRLATDHRSSTLKYADGIMQRALDNALAEGRRVYSWCAFEVAEQCHEPDCAVCEKYCSYDRLGRKHTFREVCDGKMRRSRGWMSRDDIIQMQFLGRAFETFRAQWAPCDRPELVGQYYAHFQDFHEVGPDDTDWRPGPAHGHAAGWDFGVSDRNAVPIAQPFGPDSDPWSYVILVDCYEDGDGPTPAMSAPEVWALEAKYGRLYEPGLWGDPSGANRAPVARATNAINEIYDESLKKEHLVVLAKLGIKPREGYEILWDARCNPFPVRHKAVENRLKKRSDGMPRLLVWTGTPGGRRIAKVLRSIRRPERNGVPYGEEPVKDENYHLASAIEFLLYGLDEVGGHLIG